MRDLLGIFSLGLMLVTFPAAWAQERAVSPEGVDLRLQIAGNQQPRRPITAVAWLDPSTDLALPVQPAAHRYTLLQKNRMFTPHLLVVPVGAVVGFPNADPFFHNVFSLFDGKRFDLGLYEAGTSKSVTFSRQGVSYIFCNIHPEMSAVVLALSTPLYSIADAKGAITLRNVPAGDYKLHLWIEGAPQSDLDHMTRKIHLSRSTDLGLVHVVDGGSGPTTHANKFGKPYTADPRSEY